MAGPPNQNDQNEIGFLLLLKSWENANTGV